MIASQDKMAYFLQIKIQETFPEMIFWKTHQAHKSGKVKLLIVNNQAIKGQHQNNNWNQSKRKHLSLSGREKARLVEDIFEVEGRKRVKKLKTHQTISNKVYDQRW